MTLSQVVKVKTSVPAMTIEAAEQNPTIMACEMKLTRNPRLNMPSTISITPVRNVKLTANTGSELDASGGDFIRGLTWHFCRYSSSTT